MGEVTEKLLIKPTETYKKEYECILRLRIWNRKNHSTSWSIYSCDRYAIQDIVIHKVTWDMDSDIKKVMDCEAKDREKLLKTWPSVINANKYISISESGNFISELKKFDRLIENGFCLYENENPSWEWRDLELLRLYDWGQIHITWSTNKRNKKVEKKIKDLIYIMDYLMNEKSDNIFSMKLKYNIMPEEYKRLHDES